MKNQPVIQERLFNSTLQKVWSAISDKKEMKQWYFDLAEFRAEIVYEFQFSGGPAPERQYRHLCKITEVVPEKKLTYSWRYDGYAGKSFVTFELFPEGNSTRVKLTHAGLETFPDEPDFAKNNFVEGWTDIIGRSLKEFVEKK